MAQKNTSTPSRSEVHRWLKESKLSADRLLLRTEDICNSLFSGGDLTGYLSLLHRLHRYDSRNLLLIYDQFPAATCLAAFRTWQQLIGSTDARVIRPEWQGRGIELLAPFTDFGEDGYFLSWYSVRQFDVLQTTMDPEDCPIPPSPYQSDEDHVTYLLLAVQSALSYLYDRSIVLTSGRDPVFRSVLSHQITDASVYITREASPVSQLQALTEAISSLSFDGALFTPAEQVILSQSMCYCLFERWGIPDVYPPPYGRVGIQGIPETQRQHFLDQLQRRFRLLEETVACAYQAIRKEDPVYSLEDALSEPFGPLIID